jgi:hypothetical protein
MLYSSVMFSHTKINMYTYICMYVCMYVCMYALCFHTHIYIYMYALLLLYSCCTTALPLYMLQSCFTNACLAVCVYVYALLLLYSGFTYNMYNIYNIGIYSCWESCRTKAFILKHLNALQRHLALVNQGLPGLKHFIVRLY